MSSRDEDAASVFVYYEHTELSSIPSNIVSLRIDKSVKRSPPNAFHNLESLTTVEYEEGLQVIGEEAFMFCSNLREQQFPSTLIEIGKNAFAHCDLLRSLGDLPPSLVRIRDYAFQSCTKLQTFESTNMMLGMGKGVFNDCHNLSHVILPRGMSSIPGELFYNCASLVDVEIPPSVTEIGTRSFCYCKNLSLISLPKGLKTIGLRAFEGTAIRHLDCPETVESINERAFGNCERLESAVLPPKMEVISHSTFAGCRNLLVAVDIPPSVTEIKGWAFCGCKSLSLIGLPKGLKTIGSEAFEGTAIIHFDCPETVESIDRSAFEDCESLQSAVLPPKLEVISECTFINCRNLKEITIPHSVVRIQPNAFIRCVSLKNVIFSKESRLQRIEKRAFMRCPSLTHLWLPPTVEFIEDGAFAGCRSLLSIEAPETLRQIVFLNVHLAGIRTLGYQSLVNLYLPPSHLPLDPLDVGPSSLNFVKLFEAEGNYPALVDKLKRRFDNLPLHRVCYFQSYHSLQETVTQTRTIVNADPSAIERVDFLGMTPFHILALSKRPRLDLFQELLSVSSSLDNNILNCQDVFGSTPLDYLRKNVHSPEAVSVTKSLLAHVLDHRISFLGLDSWRDELWLELGTLDATTELKASIRSIRHKLALLERMEALSLLEMSIWKMRALNNNSNAADDRESCRIDCGSEIVIQNVLPLLEPVTHLDDEDEDSEDEIQEDEESSDDD